MLRYAPRFHRKKIGKNFTKKNLTKKNFTKKFSQKKFSQKKISENFPWIFFSIFFGYPGFTANLGYACENLGV
jgi:hypothetical protein